MSDKWSFVRQSYHAPDHLPIPAVTGPLDLIAEKHCLVLADFENLLLGARQLGCSLFTKTLAHRLEAVAKTCRLVGFISTDLENYQCPDELRCASPWQLVRNGATTRDRSADQWPNLRNSDNLMLFRAGWLIEREPFDAVILGSGDGSLVCSLARFIRDLDRSKTILSLSISGSSSQRINARRNPNIDANILVGFDSLSPKR